MGKKKTTISAVVIAKNEEKKLEDCFKSLKWCDEIVLINDHSTDNTTKIAKKYTDKIFTPTGTGYLDARNFSLKKASGDWILYIDADERVPAELAKEIAKAISYQAMPAGRQVLGSTYNGKNWYVIPRKNYIFGKEFKHGGQYPDYVKRLFKKFAISGWSGEIHEEPIVTGEMGYLKNDLVHLKHDYIFEMVDKTNRWSAIEAKLMLNAGHPPMTILRFLSAMWREFYTRFIRQKAFLDGFEGIIYGVYQIWSRFLSYAKLWEMQQK